MISHYILEFLGAFVGSFFASYLILKQKTTKEKLLEISIFALFLTFTYVLVDFVLGIR